MVGCVCVCVSVTGTGRLLRPESTLNGANENLIQKASEPQTGPEVSPFRKTMSLNTQPRQHGSGEGTDL